MPLIKKYKTNPSKGRGHAKPSILPPLRRKPIPPHPSKGPKTHPQQGVKTTQVHKPVHKPIHKPLPPKKKPYNWMLKDQQRLSNKYGITTYNTDGTVATMPQVKPEKKWWSEDIVEGEY